MRALMLILALVCFAGMRHTSPAQSTDAGSGLSDAELQRVRERLPCLEPGMTMKEVFDVLGIDLGKRAYGEWGSGPTDDYRVVYQLAPATNEHGYNLIIVRDQKRKYKRAEIACWTPPNKCAEDNEKVKNKDCPKDSQKRDP